MSSVGEVVLMFLTSLFAGDFGFRPALMAVFVMLPVNGQPLQLVGEQGRDSGIGIFLAGDHRQDATLHQAIVQRGTHAAGNQDIDSGQRFGELLGAGVQALLHGKLDQAFADEHAFFKLVNPEFAALSSVLGDHFSILAGDGDFHAVVSFAVDQEGQGEAADCRQ